MASLTPRVGRGKGVDTRRGDVGGRKTISKTGDDERRKKVVC
jgi:hypothetical protein